MFKLLKKIFVPLFICVFLGYWFQYHYREQEIPMYSLKCVHDEYQEVIHWYLIKRKRKDEVPYAMYDGPWMSESFSLTSETRALVKIGQLEEANMEFFVFSMNPPYNQEKIKINRRTLKLALNSHLDFSYNCDIRNPGEFWQYVQEKLKVKRAQLKI